MIKVSNSYKPITNLLFISTRNYVYKSDQIVKWVRPEKIPFHKPEKTGDLKPLENTNLNEIAKDFKKSKLLENAPELTKKLFTYQFLPNKFALQDKQKDYVASVKNHFLDDDSLEVRVAKYTTLIRFYQMKLEEFPLNTKMKTRLNKIIGIRKRLLKSLRNTDYKKFEWVLEKLCLLYKPEPRFPFKVTRKDSVIKLTDKYCEDIRNERLNEYKIYLDSQKEDFLRGKISILEKIIQDEKSFGLVPSITQEDIDLTIERLKCLKLNSNDTIEK